MGKGKVCVYADSVLCLGQMNESKEAIARWEGQVEGLEMYPSYQESVGIDGEPLNSSGIFSRIFVVGYSSREPKRFGQKEHQTRRV